MFEQFKIMIKYAFLKRNYYNLSRFYQDFCGIILFDPNVFY
jgi:hypothetical protein